MFRKRKILQQVKREIKNKDIGTIFRVGSNTFQSYSSILMHDGELMIAYDGRVYLNGEFTLTRNTTQLTDSDALWLGKKIHFWIGKQLKAVK